MLDIQNLPLSKLRPAKWNPRKNLKPSDPEYEKLKKSLLEFGYVDPLVWNRRTGHLVGGHQRLKVLEELGHTEVSVSVVDLSPEKEKVLNVALNKISGGWDVPSLSSLLLELDVKDLAVSGWDVGELDSLMKQFRRDNKPHTVDEDDVPDLPERPNIVPGRLYKLGRHRLLCGDSTRQASKDALLAGVSPDMILTDPPYCSGGFQEADREIGSIGSTKGATIQRDTLSTKGYMSLIAEALDGVNAETLYLFTDWRMWTWTFDVAERSGFPVKSMLVWDKGTHGMGFPWRTQHELILFAKRTPSKPIHGDRGNVLQASRSGNKNHPTEKPVSLITQIIDNTIGDVIYDPFGGSGTTLIAAEQWDRTCYTVELDPGYCDVIIQRYENLTGQTVERSVAE
ncbi:MAG: Modification methylase DpnIIB [Firmicutes bacterium]|nr:Modification methylase DpnIIB [candidate division NPL-UPA2 bacterium]